MKAHEEGLATFAALGYLQQGVCKKTLVIIADSGNNYLNQIYDQTWLNKFKVDLLGIEKLIIELNKVH